MKDWFMRLCIRCHWEPERAADGIGITIGLLIGIVLAIWLS